MATKRAVKSGRKVAARKASAKKLVAKTASAKKSVAKTASAKKTRAKKHPKRQNTAPDALTRLRKICLSLPESVEVEAWGEPTFRVHGKIFAMHASSGTHHDAGRPAVWIMSVNIEQDLVLRARPDRYFKPPYVGPGGWIGAWLDRKARWAEIDDLLRDAWRRRAPKKLAAQLED